MAIVLVVIFVSRGRLMTLINRPVIAVPFSHAALSSVCHHGCVDLYFIYKFWQRKRHFWSGNTDIKSYKVEQQKEGMGWEDAEAEESIWDIEGVE